MTIKIQKWFEQKNFTQSERYIIATALTVKIERETEKAALVAFNADDGSFKAWMPKSVFEVLEKKEIDAEASEIEVGQTVEHPKFGRGTVKAIEANGKIASVQFGENIKEIVSSFLKVC